MLRDRLVGIRVDPMTGSTFHLKFNPPTVDAVRDRLVTRPEHTHAAVQAALDRWTADMGVLLPTFGGVVVPLSGDAPPTEVFQRLVRALHQVGAGPCLSLSVGYWVGWVPHQDLPPPPCPSPCCRWWSPRHSPAPPFILSYAT